MPLHTKTIRNIALISAGAFYFFNKLQPDEMPRVTTMQSAAVGQSASLFYDFARGENPAQPRAVVSRILTVYAIYLVASILRSFDAKPAVSGIAGPLVIGLVAELLDRYVETNANQPQAAQVHHRV